METTLNQLAPTAPPPCLSAAASAAPADSSLADKGAAPEGEFAILLASLQKPAAETGACGQSDELELLVPAALQPLQYVCPAGAGGEAASLSVTVPVRQPESGNMLTGNYESDCLPGALTAELLPALAAAEGKRAALSDALGTVEPAPADIQAEDTKTVLPQGNMTAAETAQDGMSSVFERQLATAGAKDDYAAAKMALSGTQQATPPEGRPAGDPEQEKGETRPAESSAQPSVRPTWTAQEPQQAEAVRRVQAIKSAVLEQVLEKMVFSRSESGEAVFVRLKPPSLGEVQISLHLEEGRLTGRIVAENAMVRELLEASLSQLRQRLEAQQIHVAELTVSTGQEREWGRGRDRPDGMSSFFPGREKSKEVANAVPATLPGLLNALA